MLMKDKLGNAVELKPGMLIKVSFGSEGSQKAKVSKVTRTGNVHVRKYRRRSQSWTNPIRLYEGELIGVMPQA